MVKRIVDYILGVKLPCGHGRFRGKPGKHINCPICGTGYTYFKVEEDGSNDNSQVKP